MRKGNAKSFVAIMMGLILVLGLCSCKKSPNETTSSKQNDAESKTQTTTGAKKEESKEDTGDEVTHLKLMLKTRSTYGDWNNFWCLDQIEKYCGIRFEVEQVSQEGWNEKKNLAFATNSLPDVFLNDLTDTDLATYGSQGVILPLEKYMTKDFMPSLYEVMDEGYPHLISAMTFPDGHVYCIHGISGSEREYAKSRFFINKEWAKNLNVPIPTTLDEYYNYLKAIKEQDANGNGDTGDEIPLGGSYGTSTGNYYDGFIPILTAFGMTEKAYEAVDHKVVYNPTTPTYKEFLKYMHRLYSEGLIDQEYFTQTEDQRKAKEAQGVIGAFTDYASWLNIPDPLIWKQYGSIEPMTSSYNSKKLWPAKDIIFYGGLAVTNNVKDEKVLEKICKFVDWCYSKEGTEILWRGPAYGTWDEYPEVGYQVETDEKGNEIRTFLYPEDKFKSSNAFYSQYVKPGNNFWPYVTIPSRQDVQILDEDTYRSETATNSYCLTYDIMTNQAPFYHVGWPSSIKYTGAEADELSLIATDLDSYKRTMEAKMINGDADIDSTFDEFVKGIQDRNLDRYLEILQGAYDRYESKR